MRNFLADLANAWVRGTLHAVNGVLFAKYLALAWGFEPAMAMGLSGTAAGVVLMRGKIMSALRTAWRLRRTFDCADESEPPREIMQQAGDGRAES